jgi:drug/metabolite transporter (DMT)-like permease
MTTVYPPVRPRRPLRAYLYLSLAMLSVGSIVPASRVFAVAVPPALAGALRLLVAAAVLLPWAARRERAALSRPLTAYDALLLAVQAAAGTVGFTVLLALGTARTTASEASIISGTLPVVAALLAMALFGERPTPRRWAAVALAVAGLCAIAWPTGPGAAGAAQGGKRLAGDLLVLAAVACESLFILLQKRLRCPLPALAQSAVMCALGLAYLLPLAAGDARRLSLGAVPLAAWLAIAYYGLVPTVLGFVWWYRGAQEVSGSEAGLFTALMPVAGTGLSALVLGEALGPRHVVALALVLAAMLLGAGGDRPRASSQRAAPGEAA